MGKQNIISLLQLELKQTAWDIKAEHLLMIAVKKGLNMDDFLICCDTFFKREFSQDVFTAILKEDSKKQELLELHLSRTGLYDLLPEGLFFQIPQKKSRQINVDELALEYRHNKKREENIRRFFLPFDNAFFIQRLRLEQEESSLLEGLGTGILNDYFIRFWGLPPSLPKMFAVPLLLLLPHANKIAGNLPLTSECFSYLLKEKVLFAQKNSAPASADDFEHIGLGQTGLGVNMICGNTFFEDSPVIEIKIGPLQNSKIKDYLDKGKRTVLLEIFNRFFIPAGVDTVITIKLSPDKDDIGEDDVFSASAYIFEREDMLLEKGSEPVLGYSTVLG